MLHLFGVLERKKGMGQIGHPIAAFAPWCLSKSIVTIYDRGENRQLVTGEPVEFEK